MAKDIEFRPAAAGDEPGAGLLRAMRDEIAQLYPIGLDAPGMPSATPADFAPPGGIFLLGWRNRVAVCCGGVKRLPDGVCEIKRMYVVPAARRKGIARALLGALEDVARDLGYSVVRLDTGPKQPHAKAMYEAAGYRPIGNFNANPVASFWGEIKRMYVVPAARRQGIARALLGALEDAARDLGYSVVRLDTGPEQPHAQAMYEAAGYRPIGNFNANPVASFWGEKRL